MLLVSVLRCATQQLPPERLMNLDHQVRCTEFGRHFRKSAVNLNPEHDRYKVPVLARLAKFSESLFSDMVPLVIQTGGLKKSRTLLG